MSNRTDFYILCVYACIHSTPHLHASVKHSLQHFNYSFSILPSIFPIICPQGPLPTTYLCTLAPCQSSCHQSGRHGALNPPKGNNLSDRCTPGCNRRRAGPDPQRQRWPGSAVACRNELESRQRADTLVHTHLYPPTHTHT